MNLPKLLFLCTANSCRSQMAEGLVRQLLDGRYAASSAGSNPSGRVDPRAVTVMAELGIDISRQRSKGLSEFAGQSFAAVITVCDSAREACPLPPAAGVLLHHSFADPPKLALGAGSEAEQLDCYRRVRDEIAEYVSALPALLARESAGAAAE